MSPLFITMVLALIAAPTLAQTTSPSPSSVVGAAPRARALVAPGHLPAPSAQFPVGDREARRRQIATYALQNASQARLDRAQRVAEMINSGDRAGASALVTRERDHRLARGVSEMRQSQN